MKTRMMQVFALLVAAIIVATVTAIFRPPYIVVEEDGFPARGQCVEDEFQIQDRCFHIGDARKVG
jgi:hypothetical protein